MTRRLLVLVPAVVAAYYGAYVWTSSAIERALADAWRQESPR